MVVALRCKRPGTAALRILPPMLLGLLTACGAGGHSPQSQNPPPMSPPPAGLTRVSTDSFTNSASQHATEVEPGTFAFGATVVSAFQVGRIYGGGGADIGFAISTDAGKSWKAGLLPGITVFDGGAYTAVSDASVAYDQAHSVWLIATLPIGVTIQVAVTRSSNAVDWENPVLVSHAADADKPWIGCDNTPTSPFYGNCYVEWDDPSASNGLIQMSTSKDGGLTWGAPMSTSNLAAGVGGIPVVQPNGTVVVPIQDAGATAILAFRSTDGGNTWNAPVTVSSITDHLVAGDLRTSSLPSAAVDNTGQVYVVWQDCRFRTGCVANDIVMSTSTDGVSWSAPARIPIDSVSNSEDHFIPAVAVDPASGGSTAHVGLTYYFYPSSNCTAATCQLNVGFISSQDGGASWSAPRTLAGPMSVTWLPSTFSGVMVGDYVSTVYAQGNPYGVFAVAQANSGAEFDEATYATTAGLLQSDSYVRLTSAGEQPVPGAQSDHPARRFHDVETVSPRNPPH